MAVDSRAQQRARPHTVPRRGGARARELLAERLRAVAPSRRSLAVGCALLASAGVLYAIARETSAFALRTVVVTGAPAAVRAQVRRAVSPILGTSLVGLDGAALVRRIEALPTVVAARYDRGFPHTLRITVVPERPAAVVRSGRSTWLVSARGRVVARIGRHDEPSLPRIWLPSSAQLVAGAFLPGRSARRTAQALGLAGGFPIRIRSASLGAAGLVLRLGAGWQLRLGTPDDIRLKLAVARRALASMPAGTTYLDVSVPSRAVAGTDGPSAGNPQLSTGA